MKPADAGSSGRMVKLVCAKITSVLISFLSIQDNSGHIQSPAHLNTSLPHLPLSLHVELTIASHSSGIQPFTELTLPNVVFVI